MHENVTIGELIINGDVWKSLAPDLQEIIKSAAHETFFRWWARWQKQNADALKEFLEKHKVQVLKTPDDILYDFLKAWDRIAAREAEKDPFFRKVLESQKAYAGLVVPAKRFMFPNYDFAANYYWPVKKAAAAPAAPAAKPAAPAKK
jgi:TRAP-type mannitol/chloroaromatic compound transport system substrate-binding protein